MPTSKVKLPHEKRTSPIRTSRGGRKLHPKSETLTKHEDVQLSRYGLYAYIRKSDDKVMYIGKDSVIHEKNRKSHHENPDNINKQVVNKNLQANINDYYYQVIAIAADKLWMEDIESSLIGSFKAHGMCEWNVANDLPQEVVND